jgi:hypothetical protein
MRAYITKVDAIFKPSVVGFILGLVFLQLFLMGLPKPDALTIPTVVQKFFACLYFPAFYLQSGRFGFYPLAGDGDASLPWYIVSQWTLLGLLAGLSWLYFGRKQKSTAA